VLTDRSLRVWSLSTLDEPSIRYALVVTSDAHAIHPNACLARTWYHARYSYARISTEFDYGTAVAFTADSHNILYARSSSRTLHVLKRIKVAHLV